MKYYFWPDNDELMCFTLDSIKDQMRYNEIYEAEIIEATIVTGGGFFFCDEYNEIGESGESCGLQCQKYAPRNGKSGRCKHHKNTYEPSDKVRTLKIKP